MNKIMKIILGFIDKSKNY